MQSQPATNQADDQAVTLTMSLRSDNEFAEIPDFAQATISHQDVENWKKLAAKVVELDLYCIQLHDYRCTFWDDQYLDDDEEGERITQSNTAQDGSVLVVTQDSFGWRGYFKGTSIDWSTGLKKLEDALIPTD